jgi:hypothetical protein
MAVILPKRQIVAKNNTSNISTFILVMAQCFGCWKQNDIPQLPRCMPHFVMAVCVFQEAYTLLQQ